MIWLCSMTEQAQWRACSNKATSLFQIQQPQSPERTSGGASWVISTPTLPPYLGSTSPKQESWINTCLWYWWLYTTKRMNNIEHLQYFLHLAYELKSRGWGHCGNSVKRHSTESTWALRCWQSAFQQEGTFLFYPSDLPVTSLWSRLQRHVSFKVWTNCWKMGACLFSKLPKPTSSKRLLITNTPCCASCQPIKSVKWWLGILASSFPSRSLCSPLPVIAGTMGLVHSLSTIDHLRGSAGARCGSSPPQRWCFVTATGHRIGRHWLVSVTSDLRKTEVIKGVIMCASRCVPTKWFSMLRQNDVAAGYDAGMYCALCFCQYEYAFTCF